MAIAAGQDILVTDVTSVANGISSANKLVETDATGKIDSNFLYALKFGGDGSDGALSVSSGTINIDLGGAAVFVKNYSSISITGTGKVTFSNPHANGSFVILKSVGNVTLTSSQAPMLDFSGLGAAGGGSSSCGGSTSTNGSAGTGALNPLTTGGGAPSANGGSSSGTTAASPTFSIAQINANLLRYTQVFCGSGGGGGSCRDDGGSGSTGGAGGRGGGCGIIECGGSWNFTTAGGISVAGSNGSAGTTTSRGVGCGGGGGAGGFFLGLYNSLTANSGTVTTSGGTGGATDRKAPFATGAISAPAGGSNPINTGSNGGGGNNSDPGPGGNGAAGSSLIAKNVQYA